MANQTRVIIGICVVVTLVMFGVGVVIGFFTGKASEKTSINDDSPKADGNDNPPGSCSDKKLSTSETREKLISVSEWRAQTLITAEQLREYINQDTGGIRILDTTFALGGADDFRDMYERSHIPTSVFYDAWQCANSTAMYPMTLPNRECFETQIQSLGINSDTHVIVYDRLGSLPTYRDSFKSLPSFRAWWLFRLHGHRNISVLDGGFWKWENSSYEVTADVPAPLNPSIFRVNFDASLVRYYEDMVEIVHSKKEQILDSRPLTHPSLINSGSNAGYIPCAKHLSYLDMFQDDGTIRPDYQLLQMFSLVRLDFSQPIISMCYVGLAAPFMAGVLHILGLDVPVYHGSWIEWSQRADDEYKMMIEP